MHRDGHIAEDETRALWPLEKRAEVHSEEVPETFPSGI